MSQKQTKEALDRDGYVIITGILTQEEIDFYKQRVYDWQSKIPGYKSKHKKISPHGIHKTWEAGHTDFAWGIRTHPNVLKIFKDLWGVQDDKELAVSYDGSCYIPKDHTGKDNVWTHTDQAPDQKGIHCYQGLVSLTDNKERTLVVYEGTHLEHEKYFRDRNITGSSRWNKIELSYLNNIKDKKRVLEVPAGSLVLWESRTFHQNQYGKPGSEERIVQYVSYLPKNDIKYTSAQEKKRLKYFQERRTTSHWAYPVKVNGLQPQTYGDNSLSIDYDGSFRCDLSDINHEKIMNLI
tara:strand:+ start:4332 stop:5213 length:882 start_codon:yes stop_codon:yes gene_type:complete